MRLPRSWPSLVLLSIVLAPGYGCSDGPTPGDDAGDAGGPDGAGDASASDDGQVPDAAAPNEQPTIREQRVLVEREGTTAFVLTPVDAEGDPFTVSMRRCWSSSTIAAIEVCTTSACTETISLECGAHDDPASPVVALDVEMPMHVRFRAVEGSPLPAEVHDAVGFMTLPLLLDDDASEAPARSVDVLFDARIENTPPEVLIAGESSWMEMTYQIEAEWPTFRSVFSVIDSGYSFISQGQIRFVLDIAGGSIDTNAPALEEVASCLDTRTPNRVAGTCHPVAMNAMLAGLEILRPELGPEGTASATVDLFVDDLGYSGPCAEGHGPPTSPCPLTDAGRVNIEWIPAP